MYKIKEDKKHIESFLKQCRENVMSINADRAKRDGIKTVFTIGCTKNYKNSLSPYTTPSRFNKYFYITGCVVFTQTQAILVAAMLDGLVDIIAIDAEKKLPIITDPDVSLLPKEIMRKMKKAQDTVAMTEAGNLSSACFDFIKKSKVFEFKANDLTVDAVWTFVSNKMKVLSGKKIAIIGAGNIGSKLALKFVESGSTVTITRRDSCKGYAISNALNLIKPESTISTVAYSDNILKSCFHADAILGCTDGYPAIEWEHICASKKNSLIIDVGKGAISKDAFRRAIEIEKPIYRTDISAALDAHLIMLQRTDEIIKTSLDRRVMYGLNFVSGGVYGHKGDIVVDNVNKPKVVFGIANGEGDFIRRLNRRQSSLLKKLKNKICK